MKWRNLMTASLTEEYDLHIYTTHHREVFQCSNNTLQNLRVLHEEGIWVLVWSQGSLPYVTSSSIPEQLSPNISSTLFTVFIVLLWKTKFSLCVFFLSVALCSAVPYLCLCVWGKSGFKEFSTELEVGSYLQHCLFFPTQNHWSV